MAMMMQMTTDRDSVTESGRTVSAGTAVVYAGHVAGGMVAVEIAGAREVMNPNAFAELR